MQLVQIDVTPQSLLAREPPVEPLLVSSFERRKVDLAHARNERVAHVGVLAVVLLDLGQPLVELAQVSSGSSSAGESFDFDRALFV